MIFRKKALSDAEYIETLRSRDRFVRRTRWIWPVLLIALMGCLIGWSSLSLRLSKDLPADKPWYYEAGVVLGVSFGFVFVVTAAQAALALKHWNEARTGYRTERLLLEYHDRLREREAADGSARSADDDVRP